MTRDRNAAEDDDGNLEVLHTDRPEGWLTWKAKAEEMQRNWEGATQTHIQERARADGFEAEIARLKAREAEMREALAIVQIREADFREALNKIGNGPFLSAVDLRRIARAVLSRESAEPVASRP